MTRPDERGFTLLELMTVVLVLGLVLAFSLPSFVSYAATQNLVGAADNIAAQMRLAREKAIATGQTQTIHFTLNYQNSDYHIHNSGVGAKWSLPQNIVYYTGSGTNSQYVFQPNGRSNASGWVIVQDHRGRRDTVSVQISGLVTHR